MNHCKLLMHPCTLFYLMLGSCSPFYSEIGLRIRGYSCGIESCTFFFSCELLLINHCKLLMHPCTLFYLMLGSYSLFYLEIGLRTQGHSCGIESCTFFFSCEWLLMNHCKLLLHPCTLFYLMLGSCLPFYLEIGLRTRVHNRCTFFFSCELLLINHCKLLMHPCTLLYLLLGSCSPFYSEIGQGSECIIDVRSLINHCKLLMHPCALLYLLLGSCSPFYLEIGLRTRGHKSGIESCTFFSCELLLINHCKLLMHPCTLEIGLRTRVHNSAIESCTFFISSELLLINHCNC